MNTGWEYSVSASPSTVHLNSITSYIGNSPAYVSPIDRFYTLRSELLATGSTHYFNSNPFASSLLLVGLISISENYLREIVAKLVSLCPKARKRSAKRSVPLSSAWIGYGDLERASMENTSLASKENIKSILEKSLGITIDQGGLIASPLEEFDKLCELRHSIVHGASILTGKNAVTLGLPNSSEPLVVSVSYAEFQEAAQICTVLVQSVNLELFKVFGSRWRNEWPNSTMYTGKDMNKVFTELWNVFASEEDIRNSRTASELSKVKTRNRIR